MSFLTGGQDFVVAGNNRRRGGGGLASLGRLASHLAVQKHLISHRADEQIRVQGAGHESKAKWNAVGDMMKKKTSRDDQLSFEDDVLKRYDDDHEDVKSGKIKKGEDGNYPYLRERLAQQYLAMGQVEGRDGTTRAGSQVGVIRSQEVTGRPEKTPSRTTTPKPPKTPKPKFDPNNPNNGFTGYTPRKTGTGGYDEALKEGKIDQETYDSYLEDSKKPGKDYMPKQASTAIDTLVKERDSRKVEVNTSAAIASSPVNGFNPKEEDIQDSLHANNTRNYFPFESTAGSSGNFSPTNFNDDGTPTYSEINAEESRSDAAKNPFDTREGYKERTSSLTEGLSDGKGGNK